MSVVNLENLHPEARGLRLNKINAKGELIPCELVMFTRGAAAVNTVLRRAALSGVVKIEPYEERSDYFADVYTSEDDWEQTIHLDRKSYAALKSRWMRCKLESHP